MKSTKDHMRESCGVFGIFNNEKAAHLTYLGLYALQHRGQESAGIVVSDREKLREYKGMGLLNQVFKHESIFDRLQGIHAIGHNRYSTTGSSTIANAQPIKINFKAGQLAGAHNGNLTNAEGLRLQMEERGSIFMSTTDTEVIMHLIARSRHDSMHAMILDSLSRLRGSYSLVFLTTNALYAARDHLGVRPLVLGRLNGSTVVASETCAFDLLGAEFVREIEPGEMIRVTDTGIDSFRIPDFHQINRYAHCIFEFVYFSRPDSFAYGENVDKIRRELGRQLAREHPAQGADIVMGVPDSATTAALGYAEQSQIRYDIGLIRNHYIGRTFIHPAQDGRDFGVRIKFNTVKGVLRNKRVVIVDDSIVRGTTMKKIVRLIRSAGPKEVHLRISSPPITAPCYYGIDMPTRTELIASDKTVEKIRRYLDVDTLGYLSIDGMLATTGDKRDRFCAACFTGSYPIEIEKQ